MKRRFLAVLALITLVGLAAPVAAHDDRVGRGGGTPGTSSKFRLVGANPLAGRGMNAALAIYRRYGYVGNRTDGSEPLRRQRPAPRRRPRLLPAPPPGDPDR
jgi:hypothetical protein